MDALIIGPYDLSGSFGISGQIDAPQLVGGVATVQRLYRMHGKPYGIFAATADKARAYAQSGFNLIAAGMDRSVLLKAFTSLRNQSAGRTGRNKVAEYSKLKGLPACRGGMGERLKPAVLKTVVLERVPGVRIPLPPPYTPVNFQFQPHSAAAFARSIVRDSRAKWSE